MGLAQAYDVGMENVRGFRLDHWFLKEVRWENPKRGAYIPDSVQQ
jgi:hypothetical protein